MAEARKLFRVGASKIDITPPLEVPYLGLEPRHSRFRSVRDRLFVRTLFVSNGQDEAAIVNADLIGFSNTLLGPERNFTAEIREKVEERTNISQETIMLASSHIHSTPDTLDLRPLRESPGATEWLSELADKIVESVVQAKGEAFEARLKIGKGNLVGFSKNRRGEECLDTEVILMAFESEDKMRRILVVNFACHPVIVQVQDQVSTDYVGTMQSMVERSMDGTEACLFLQGACGDINPWVDDSRNFEDVERMGRALGEEVLGIFRRIERKESPTSLPFLGSATETLLLPSRPLPSREEVNSLASEIQFLQRKMEEEQAGKAEIEKKVLQLKFKLAEMVYRLGQGSGPFAAEIQVVRLGNACLVGISGEPFCAMGRRIKEMALPLVGVPVGYTNGYVGYIIPPESWERGGYETECGPWSKVSPDSHGIVLASIERLLERVR